jgi:hypothetical protein
MHTSTVGGEKISYSLKTYSPPLVIKLDEKMLNQSSPLNCSYLLYSLLSKGEIDAASKLSNDPEKTKMKYVRYKERIGEQEFKKTMSDYFSGKAKLLHELTIGAASMLLLHDADDELLAQMYVKVGDKYFVAEKETREVDQLGKLFNAVQEGTLKLR